MGAAAEAALDIGLAGASQGIGIGMGMLTAPWQDRRQVRQQEKLTKVQEEANKRMADYTHGLQYDMWNKTNYGAQMEHLKAAGLNPGLIYGMSGGGGATTGSASAGGVSGGSAAGSAGEAMQGMGLGLQAGLMQAQKRLMEANAKKAEADAAATAGVQTELGHTQIASLKQGIENAKAQERLTIVEGALKGIEVTEKGMSQDDRMDLIHYQVEKIKKEMMLLDNDVFITRATMANKVDIVAAELAGAILKNEATATGIQVDKAQIAKWTQELAQGWTNLDRQERELKLKTFAETIKANYPGITDVLGKQLNDALNTLAEIHGERWGRKGRTEKPE